MRLVAMTFKTRILDLLLVLETGSANISLYSNVYKWIFRTRVLIEV